MLILPIYKTYIKRHPNCLIISMMTRIHSSIHYNESAIFAKHDAS